MSFARAYIFLIALFSSIGSAAETAAQDAAKDLIGCWKSADSGALCYMKFEPSRVVTYEEGELYIYAASYESGKVHLTKMGSKLTASVQLNDGKLTWSFADGHGRILEKIEKEPDELKMQPMVLGTKALPPEELKKIQAELSKRVVEDQAVRKNPARQNDMGKVDADNTGYVTQIAKEYGWIDAQRFGAETSGNAFLIVQHSMKLPLMLAALPEIEKDTKAGRLRDGQSFALLYDRTQLYMGGKQRYGTQVGRDAKGDPIVLPLEDRSKVEQYRKELGIFPLTQYLAMFEQQFGKKVKFSDE